MLESGIVADPLWYKDAIIYELHVKAFCDSNGDGIGDFIGLTQKLDYLESLGVTTIWLLPFYPSPLKDDGYDIADYYNIHPDYGTMRDFKTFLREAHKRGLRVITELVINHTSDQHKWFQRARLAKPGSDWRNFYVWSDTPEKYKDARIIFKDFETSNWAWDPIAKAYYWHRFYSHQPDLNFDNPRVQEEILKVMDYWFEMGVDGLRLDAIPYLFQREGTNCENLKETYEFIGKLREWMDKKYPERMLLAEANQWPEDAVAYFGEGNMCHMAFHFPLMPRMFMSIRLEDRFPIIDILEQTPTIPENCQWALFLRNHDELTLEMVTDEERDYMYRVYARDPGARINLGIRRRLAPLLENNRRTIELMNVLLFSLPGTPVIYYGDEIGMGDNFYLGDRNGVRTPMQWNADRNAGFSQVNPQRLYLPVIIDPEYHYEALNAETQEQNQASLLWWMKHFISMRKRFKVFGRGDIEFLFPDNPKVFAFTRSYENELLLVVVNLSRHSQQAALDLSKYVGYVPEEVFSGNKFSVIKDSEYHLTLSSYGYYWFILTKEEEPIDIRTDVHIPEIEVQKNWDKIFEGRTKTNFNKNVLPNFLKTCRWFGGKARKIQSISIKEAIPVGKKNPTSYFLIIDVSYTEGLPELYSLPVTYTQDEAEIALINDEYPNAVMARVKVSGKDGILYDAIYKNDFRLDLLKVVSNRLKLRGSYGELAGYLGKNFIKKFYEDQFPAESALARAEQSNSSILYDDRLFLKFYRKLDEGMNPDLELGKYLTDQKNFSYVPPFLGALERRKQRNEPIVLATLQGYVQNEGDAWTMTLDTISRYIGRVLSKSGEIEEVPTVSKNLFEIELNELPEIVIELVGGIYPERAHLLGQRVGEMHNALAAPRNNGDFTPESFSLLYQRSLYQSLQSHARKMLNLSRRNLKRTRDEYKDELEYILSKEKKILNQFKRIYSKKISAQKIRIHGDLHLGQILHTGKDFLIIDFEGEPARPLSERRLKRSAIVDVAGMIRSFHYAAYNGLFNHLATRPEDAQTLEPWIEIWYRCTASVFLKSYLTLTEGKPYNPDNQKELALLLDAFLIDKAMYELGYELNNRPDWIKIPLKGIKELIEG